MKTKVNVFFYLCVFLSLLLFFPWLCNIIVAFDHDGIVRVLTGIFNVRQIDCSISDIPFSSAPDRRRYAKMIR